MVKEVIVAFQNATENPEKLIKTTKDFFGEELQLDATLTKRCELPQEPQFKAMMKTCLEAVIGVLELQYSKYCALDITEKPRKETASATRRSHNIDAEEIMGMFSASKQKSPNAKGKFVNLILTDCPTTKNSQTKRKH